MSGSTLKIIAVLSMVADHCAYFLLSPDAMTYGVLRCFGRIAFPVFALLAADGFIHTRSRIRYFLSLLAFAFISEVPWFLLNGADGTHNVLFTLALGVLALWLIDRLKGHPVLQIVSVAVVALSSWLMGTDYEWRGILLVVTFWLFRSLARHEPDSRLTLTILQLVFCFPLMVHYGFTGAMLASMVIFLYDGSRGFIQGKAWKYAFYAFYPVHLMLISLLLCSL